MESEATAGVTIPARSITDASTGADVVAEGLMCRAIHSIAETMPKDAMMSRIGCRKMSCLVKKG